MMEQQNIHSTEIETELNVRDIIQPYLKRWMWLIASVVLSVTLAYLYLKRQVPIFEVASTVLLSLIHI